MAFLTKSWIIRGLSALSVAGIGAGGTIGLAPLLSKPAEGKTVKNNLKSTFLKELSSKDKNIALISTCGMTLTSNEVLEFGSEFDRKECKSLSDLSFSSSSQLPEVPNDSSSASSAIYYTHTPGTNSNYFNHWGTQKLLKEGSNSVIESDLIKYQKHFQTPTLAPTGSTGVFGKLNSIVLFGLFKEEEIKKLDDLNSLSENEFCWSKSEKKFKQNGCSNLESQKHFTRGFKLDSIKNT